MTKRILITGANKGIGLATVRAVLEAQDDTYVLLGSRSEERGRSARAQLLSEQPSWGDRVEVLQLDVTSDASVRAAADAMAAELGTDRAPLQGIVNNAGVGGADLPMRDTLETNVYGPRRVCEAFVPLLDARSGRIVNVSSAAGPMFVASCAPQRQAMLTSPEVTWNDIEALLQECLAIEAGGGDFAAAGLGDGSPYGLSKACLNAYTIALARTYPALTINACTPGFIETDLTRAHASSQGKSPQELGMKQPAEGAGATVHLLLGEPGGSGWFFGSDAQRSPLDRYRSPGDPPYTGE